MTSNFTFDLKGYTDLVNLPSEMITFGTYRISYEPPDGALESDINMSISSEADLCQMLDFFKSFLMAAGYSIRFEENLEFSEEPGQNISFPFTSSDPDLGDSLPFVGGVGSDFDCFSHGKF